MNLYRIKFVHYSQKDSQEGIITYIIANCDEEVYNYIKNESNFYSNQWKDYEGYNIDEKTNFKTYDEEWNVIGSETFKERIIRLKGDMHDEDMELNDLYYGKTLYGWELVKENILDSNIKVLLENNVAVEYKGE